MRSVPFGWHHAASTCNAAVLEEIAPEADTLKTPVMFEVAVTDIDDCSNGVVVEPLTESGAFNFTI